LKRRRGPAAPSGVARRLIGAAGLVALGSILSRLLGLVRDPVMAQFFGRNLVTDSFIQAQTLSTVVYDLLVSGMVGAALIPTLSRLAARDNFDEFWRVANAVFAIGALVLIVIVGAMEALAPLLVHVMSGGYDAATLAREIVLARLMIPTVLLMGLSAAGTAILYSLHRYRWPALAIACINLGVIVGMLALHRMGIISAAFGLLAGAAAQLLLQALALRQARMPFRPRLDWRHPEVRHIGRLYLPVAAGFLMSSLVVGGERHLYSLAAAGGLSAAQYATRLLQVPLGLVSTAVSMAILPTISRYAEATDWSAYRRMVATGLNVSVLLTLPVAAVLAVLAGPVVELLFVHGAFRQADAQATIVAFWLFAPQLPFAAADQVLINAYYAMHDTRTPNAVYFVVAVLWAVVAIPGVRIFNWPSLVAANTIQNCAHAVILFALLRRRHPAIAEEGLAAAWLRGLGATALAAGACLLLSTVALHALGSGRVRDVLTILVAGGGALLVYAIAMLLTGKKEVALLRRSFQRT
jgi:putative peptidoglycan lipid II flippase